MSHETIFMTPRFLELGYLEAPFRKWHKKIFQAGVTQVLAPPLPATATWDWRSLPALCTWRGLGYLCPELCPAGFGVTFGAAGSTDWGRGQGTGLGWVWLCSLRTQPGQGTGLGWVSGLCGSSHWECCFVLWLLLPHTVRAGVTISVRH